MSNRSTECYTAVFHYINTVYDLNPSEVITDFEGGLRKAISIVYPNCLIRGCWFHYSQAIRKKVRSCNLLKTIKSDSEANRVYHMIMCLPLLPSENFLDGFNFIKNRATEQGLLEPFQGVFAYYQSYWFDQVCCTQILLNYELNSIKQDRK